MSSEIVDGIAWTPEMRASVYPSRKIQNPAFRDAQLARIDLAYPIDPKAARKSAAYYWKENKRDIARAKTALAKNPPAWRPAVEVALARCKKPNGEHPLEVDIEAATVALELCPLFAAIPYWVAAGGLPFALRALIRCHEVVSSARVHGYTDAGTWILETREHSVDRPEDHDDAWSLLRALLAEAIEPVYDEAHGIADDARLRTAGGTPNQSGLQLALPFAFPDEESWAAASARSAIGLANQAKRGYTPALARYVSVAPIETAIELLTCTTNGAVTTLDVITICAHRGSAAGLRVLEAAIEKASNERARKSWCELLLAFRTPETAKLFERLAKRDKTIAAYANKYWELVVPAKPGKKRRR